MITIILFFNDQQSNSDINIQHPDWVQDTSVKICGRKPCNQSDLPFLFCKQLQKVCFLPHIVCIWVKVALSVNVL